MSEQAAEQAEADFAAVLAEASAAVPDETAPEQAGEETPEKESELGESTEESAGEETLTEAETAAAKLIEQGDLDGALKRLGVDPALVKVDRRQFFAMRKGLADAKAKERASEAKAAEATKLRTEAEKLYGPIAAGFAAHRQGDGAKLRAAIELLAEDSFENVLATIERGNRPLDPATAEVMRLRAELAERDKAVKSEQTAAQAKAAEQAQISKLEAQVAKTPLAKVPGAAKQIYDRVKASYDGVGYSLSVKEAYAQVKAEAEAVAKAFGAPAAPPPRGKPLQERVARTPETRRLSQAEREEAEFRKTIAEAEAAARSVERSVRRRGR